MFLIWHLLFIFKAVSTIKPSIDGKYHNGIKDFSLLVPHQIVGKLKSFHLNNYFDHFNRIEKRSFSNQDPEQIHYRLWLGNKFYQLDLRPNREFLNPNLIFEKRGEKQIEKRHSKMQKLCYYTGKVRDIEDSSAAISTCDGLLGHVKIKNKDFFIEPLKNHGPNEDGQHLHVIYDLTKKLLRKRRSSNKPSWCAVNDGDSEWEEGIKSRIRTSMNIKKRQHSFNEKTTGLKPKYMETTIVCDKSLIEFHKGHRDLDVYLLTVANTAFNAFRDPSFGSELTLSLVRVIYLDKDEPEVDLNVTTSIEATLNSFNKFAQKINAPEGDPLHHDVAILASRVDMCSGAKLENCVVCGIAKIGGACTANASANVAEDDGIYELAMTMTHEAGHLLGITHDGAEGLGKPCPNPQKVNNDRSRVWIMSVVDADAVYSGWSECSRAMAASFIKNGWADCMNDEPEKAQEKYKFSHVPIGVLYSRDEQCYLSTARKGKEFEANKTCGDPSECKNLYCQYYGKDAGCKTLNHMVADGTSCGEDKWCWNSTCVAKGQRPDAIDGGWTDWDGWSECSRTCGGGIQINKRFCNNPQQANGGRYCDGEDQKVKLCNLEPCEESVRTELCRKTFNGVSLFLQRNPCQISCLNSKGKIVWSNVTVPSGESCSWGKNPKKRCIVGECLKIGCDDEIESSAVTDDCGVCNGDGDSCTVVSGRWNQKRQNNTRTQIVTRIPLGAFNIKIREATPHESKLSILNEDGTVYVNNYEGKNDTASLEGPKQFKDGVSGYLAMNGLLENFTIDGPTREHLIFKVVYLCPEADFKWKYSFIFGNETSSNEERTYRWEQDGWTECSKACNGGIQTSTFSCIEDKLGKVSEGLCNGLIDKPDVESRACKEQPCKTRWRTGKWGKCHSCAKKGGMAARGVQCMEENPEKGEDDILVEDDKCEEPKPCEFKMCKPSKSPEGIRKKRCSLGLPDEYMESIWKQLEK